MTRTTVCNAGWLPEDSIVFCRKMDCTYIQCIHCPANIRHPELAHGFAMLEGTQFCPLSYTEESES